MNREIKFRVWDKDLKRIRYLNTEHDFIRFDSLGQGYYENMQTGLGEWFSDLMQYTGLKDKNGKEIYEGDIVRFVRNFSKYKCSKNYDFEVYFNEFLCHYALNILDDESNSYGKNGQYDILTLTGAKVKDLEVIGNIYESENGNEEK